MLDEDHREQSDICSCIELMFMYMITLHVGQIIHQELLLYFFNETKFGVARIKL